MTPAARLQNEIRLAASKLGARLFNRHVGKFWAGHVIGKDDDGSIRLGNARIVNVGVVGESDLGGFVPVVITPEMVGQTVAVFTCVEVKTTDRPSPEQLAWVAMVQKMGGRAGVARSVDEAVRIVSGSRSCDTPISADPETRC